MNNLVMLLLLASLVDPAGDDVVTGRAAMASAGGDLSKRKKRDN